MKKSKTLFFLVIIILFLGTLGACSKSNSSGGNVSNFSPIIDNNGADPNIYQENGQHYYTKTTGNNVTLWRSSNLTTVAAGESKVIWEVGTEFNSAWAPEIFHINGIWYIYVALDKYDSQIHQMYVLSNPSRDPFTGKWSLTSLKGMDDKFAIDGTVFKVGQKSYFIWSGWPGTENVAQNLYITEMLSPTEVKAEKVLISKPHYSWELMETPVVNEGPEVLINGSTINLTYSASGSWTNDYCLGLLTADISSNLMDPKSWIKSPEPILSSTNSTFGPGHNGFATSENGKENWLIYHAARWSGAGWSRSVRLQPFTFDSTGKISLKAVPDATTMQRLPAGESERIRISADVGTLSKNLKIISDSEALSKKVVTGFEEKADKLDLSLTVAKGTYAVLIYVKTSDGKDAQSTDNLSVTLSSMTEDLAIPSSIYYQPVQFTAKLIGDDKLSIGSALGGNKLSIDRIELAKIN